MKTMKWFNFLSAGFLSLALLVSPHAFGQENQQINVQDYEKIVGDVTFSLNAIEDGSLIKEFTAMQMQVSGVRILDAQGKPEADVGGAINAAIAADVAEKIQTATELLELIVSDDRLSDQQKEDYVVKLGAPLSALFGDAIIQQGDDKLDYDLKKTGGGGAFLLKAGKEWSRTFTDLVTFSRTTDPRAIELALDAHNPVNPSQLPAEGKRIYKLKERMFREWLSQSATISVQKMIRNLGENNPTVESYKMLKFAFYVPTDKKENVNDLGSAEIALRLRSSRVNAHRTVLAGIGFGALIWTMWPVDYVGYMDGYDMVSSRISDFISYGTLATITLLRNSAGSFGTIPMLKRLIEILDKPVTRDASGKIVAQQEFSKLKLPLMARILRIRSKVEKARAQIRGARSSSGAPMTCPAIFARF